MTKAQINTVLTKLNYTAGHWTNFEKVSIIILNQDSRVMTDKLHDLFCFDNDNEILYVVEGFKHKLSFNTKFGQIIDLSETSGKTDDLGQLSLETSHAIAYSDILGLVRSSAVINGLTIYK